MYLKYSTCPPWYELTAIASASSSSAATTISSTERLCPRWMTSAPADWRIRRMMLMDASCPSNRLAAVTKRSLAADPAVRSTGRATSVRRSTSAVSAMSSSSSPDPRLDRRGRPAWTGTGGDHLRSEPVRGRTVLRGRGGSASPHTAGGRAASLTLQTSQDCRLVDACATVHCRPGRGMSSGRAKTGLTSPSVKRPWPVGPE